MSSCPTSLNFSEAHAEKRTEAASERIGEGPLKRLLAYALFLMGARREDIAEHLAIPFGTLLSFLTRIGRDGLPALEDRRRGQSAFLPPSEAVAPTLEVRSEETGVVVAFGVEGAPGSPERTISLPASNPVQTKVFLLTLLQGGLLERSEVARLLGYSAVHTARLTEQLARSDAYALLDKRQGQQQDYLVTADVKAELVQQFAVDVVTRGKTSGEAIARELEERCQIRLSPRTVRHHLARMGLPTIRHSLPKLLAEVKKTSSESS